MSRTFPPFALSLSKGSAEPQAKQLRYAQYEASTSLSPNGVFAFGGKA